MPHSRSSFDADGVCNRCGQKHPGCTGHSKRTGEPCGGKVAPGQKSCTRTHGGAARQNIDAAERARIEADVIAAAQDAVKGRMLTIADIDAITDPIQLLATVAAEARHFQLVLGDMVNELGDRIHTVNTVTSTQELRVVVTLYERAMDRTITVANMLAKLGFEERRIRLEENTAAALVGAVHRALTRTVTDERHRAAITAEIVTEVRELEAATT